MTCPGSLHHLVWYGIQLLESENKGSSVRLSKNTVFPIGFGCKSFNELPLATNSLATANIESLCQIDMNTFLYATGKEKFIINKQLLIYKIIIMLYIFFILLFQLLVLRHFLITNYKKMIPKLHIHSHLI